MAVSNLVGKGAKKSVRIRTWLRITALLMAVWVVYAAAVAEGAAQLVGSRQDVEHRLAAWLVEPRPLPGHGDERAVEKSIADDHGVSGMYPAYTGSA